MDRPADDQFDPKAVPNSWVVEGLTSRAEHCSGLVICLVRDEAMSCGYRVQIDGVDKLVNTSWDERITLLVSEGLSLLKGQPLPPMAAARTIQFSGIKAYRPAAKRALARAVRTRR
jgi:hypothetical protein